MSLVRSMFAALHKGLDDFAEPRQERLRSGYPVVLTTPASGLTPSTKTEIVARFEPKPTPMLLRAWGVENGMDGILLVRTAHFGSLLTEDNGHVRTGYRVQARGRMYEPKQQVEGDGEIMFVLKDLGVIANG